MESFRTDSAQDRLTALRRPIPTNTSVAGVFPNRALALALGSVVILGVALAFFLTQRPEPSVSTAQVSDTAPSVQLTNELLDGESYVAVAAEVGTFPPNLSAGAKVRMVVVPSFESGQITRSLDEVAVVRDVTSPTELGNTFVITVQAPLSVAVAVADAQKVHLVVVEEAASS